MKQKHEVFTIDTDLIFKNYLQRNFRDRFLIRYFPEYFGAKLVKELEAINLNKIDLIWIDTPYVATPKFLESLSSFKGKLVLYIVDSILSPGLNVILTKINPALVHLLITTKHNEVIEYSNIGFRVSYDQQRISKNQILPYSKDKKVIDLLYAADYTKKKLHQLNSIIPEGLVCDVYGRNWKKNSKISIKPWLHGNDYFETINKSKISLGIQNLEMNDSLTTRIFEISTSGSLLAADRFPEIEDIFGDSIIYFDQGPDFIKKVISDNKLCERMTLESQERCINRVRFVENIIEDLL